MAERMITPIPRISHHRFPAVTPLISKQTPSLRKGNYPYPYRFLASVVRRADVSVVLITVTLLSDQFIPRPVCTLPPVVPASIDMWHHAHHLNQPPSCLYQILPKFPHLMNGSVNLRIHQIPFLLNPSPISLQFPNLWLPVIRFI
jgi:hypothetical protein